MEAVLSDDEELYFVFKETIDPRIAPEAVSVSYLHCVLKGLWRAPRINGSGLGVRDVDFLVTPYGCIGRPHRACLEAGIPVIAVKENRTCLKQESDRFIVAENYLEAAGIVMTMKSGVTMSSIRRPLSETEIIRPS